MKVFLKEAAQAGQEAAKDAPCPRCRTPLTMINYEGAPVLKCAYCEGFFVQNDKIGRIFFRKDMVFSEETMRRAELIIAQRDSFVSGARRFRLDNPWVFTCPKCLNKMRRQFFVYSYPVEVDRCVSCEGLWLDKEELELLQYIYENKERFFREGEF
jgi:LSD1 subclass zinc finger protein